ncbi:MAG TPA: hypothetical protein VFF15_03270 [Flavobacteriaceae bacterium]|nr:hypothetical protein [Flavobacteriaceae bacterium]
MTVKIYNHDSDIEVVHKYNAIELKGWVNQLQYIDGEIDNLLNLYANAIDSGEIPQKTVALFAKRKELNKKLFETVLAYSNTYRNVVECDDIQCDKAYLSEYERLRKSYQYHLDRYQKLKDSLYNQALLKT